MGTDPAEPLAARLFIEFMPTALRDALEEVKRSVGKGVVKILVCTTHVRIFVATAMQILVMCWW